MTDQRELVDRVAAVARVGHNKGKPGTSLAETSRVFYDRVAPVVSGDVSFDAVRRLFTEDDTLRTPPTVTSYAPFNGPSPHTLRQAAVRSPRS